MRSNHLQAIRPKVVGENILCRWRKLFSHLHICTFAHLHILLYLCLFLPGVHSICLSQEPPKALANYVLAPDTTFNWRNYQVIKTADGAYYEVNLVSQSWQRNVWRHRLIIYMPARAKHPNTMLVVLRHLYDRNAGLASLKVISDSTGTASAILYDIPNQPFYGGRVEDDLQAYTFSQYIKSGDETWPLLFPMVKSVVRAMDAIQHIAKKENNTQPENFVVGGHSKRGHTTWLTAAVDPRVKGIIPIAIDILNSRAQLPHQLEAFGQYSTPSKEATDLLQELKQPRGASLVQMVDPYSYREQLTLPKLIISATNDDFFATDALNLYWEGLKGPKWVLYLSNAGHVRADSDPRINNAAFAFVRAIATGKMLPRFSWTFEETTGSLLLKLAADSSAARARVWVTYSESMDFRGSQWTPKEMQKQAIGRDRGDPAIQFEMNLSLPATGFMAVYGEVECIQDGRSFLLSTQTHVSKRK